MEGQNLEFKEQWRDDALKTVCAFANADGGTIYIGVDDKGRSAALKDIKKLLEVIPNKIKDILGIVADWDNIAEPKASFKDISVKTIRHFQQLAKRRFSFIAREESVKLILQKPNLIEKGRLKRAAVLLFGKNPKKYFTSAFIQVGRFVSESEVISTDVIEGNLFEQVERTIEILRLKYLENRFYYEGIYRKEDLIYPEDALREAVINAVIHRDYMGPHTQLRVYDVSCGYGMLANCPKRLLLIN